MSSNPPPYPPKYIYILFPFLKNTFRINYYSIGKREQNMSEEQAMTFKNFIYLFIALFLYIFFIYFLINMFFILFLFLLIEPMRILLTIQRLPAAEWRSSTTTSSDFALTIRISSLAALVDFSLCKSFLFFLIDTAKSNAFRYLSSPFMSNLSNHCQGL